MFFVHRVTNTDDQIAQPGPCNIDKIDLSIDQFSSEHFLNKYVFIPYKIHTLNLIIVRSIIDISLFEVFFDTLADPGGGAHP